LKGDVRVHGGDFGKTTGFLGPDYLRIPSGWLGERIPLKEIELVEVASEESIKKFSGAVGWGFVGGLLLGPLGAAAGLLAGGKKKEVTFIVKFKDGRKLLATTDNKTFFMIQAACL
jgi:hypothetical protein